MFLLIEPTHRMLIRYHPRIGHIFVPNQRTRLPNELGGFFVVTNSSGFRSNWEFPKIRTGRPRILFFGDSTLAGDYGPNEDRFSEKVGEALGAETFNFGLSGTGTDQHLLIYEEFAREIAADLVVLCVQVDSIRRIQVTHRESLDRTTGARVMVPKPYFTLEGDGGDLTLNQVPVPLARPLATGGGPASHGFGSGLLQKAARFYRDDPHLDPVRRFVRTSLPRIQSEAYRLSRAQPYDDFRSDEMPGWRLMEAIIRKFLARSAPVPVLIVPIPTYQFSLHGTRPIYQKLFHRFEDKQRQVCVADVSTPMTQLPWADRRRLTFERDMHFSAFGHAQIADVLCSSIARHRLLPAAPVRPARPAKAPDARSRQILGISCYYHNSAACLIRDGKIVAAGEEERFTRLKNDRRFPHQAVNFCLEQGGTHPRDLDAVVFYDNAPLTFERLMHTQLEVAPGGEQGWGRFLPSWLRTKLRWPQQFRKYLHYEGLMLQDGHHRSHAASAFYPSPFDRAAILTIDGVGEWATASIGVGQGKDLRLLKEMHFPHSLGLLYSAFTQFTGFKVNSGEYKMMGLAPYGEPRYVDQILEHLVSLKDDGSLMLRMEYFGFLDRPSMVNERFATLFGGPPRDPRSRITRREIDLARSIQWVTEEAMLRMAHHAHRLTGEKKLCLAGGVALNCVANGRILREAPFEEVWIQPAAGDSGGALGAALDAYHTYFEQPRPDPQGRSLQGASYLGPSFSEDEIKAFLETNGYPGERLLPEERGPVVAALLEEGKVVGHFADRMEFGPRALGARSILGDARNQEMQATLNLKIKYRESFRPFAPAVLAEKAGEYFELRGESPYMLLVAPVVKSRRRPAGPPTGDDLLPIVRQIRSDVPAVTHVDYSARVQTVQRRDQPLYYDLIKAFEQRTGSAVIVNTSFNVRGEPIVCTPYDAYRCFMRTEMDVLVLGDHLLRKADQPPWPEPKGHVENDDLPAAPPAGNSARSDDPLVHDLARIYRREFIPIARRLRDSGWRLGGATADAPSLWIDHVPPGRRQDYFSVPGAIDTPHPQAAEMAAAITYGWRPGPERDQLSGVLTRMLEQALRHPAREEAEEVSSTVYVMF